jgi:hypothetical protein
LLAVVVLVACTACSGSTPTTGASRPTTSSSGPQSAEAIEPIDVVLQTERFLEQGIAYRVVEDRAMALCMADAGFPEPLRPVDQLTVLHEIGEPNLGWRADHGWDLAPRAEEPVPPSEEAEARGHAAFGEEEVWVETDQGGGFVGLQSVGGCRGEAIAAAYGDVDTYLLLMDGPLRQFELAAAHLPDDVWADGEARWVRCMAERGYDYQAQGNAKSVFLLRYATEEPTEQLRREEAAAALDDGECLWESGLVHAKREQAERYLLDLDPAGIVEVVAILAAHVATHAAAPIRLGRIEAELDRG